MRKALAVLLSLAACGIVFAKPAKKPAPPPAPEAKNFEIRLSTECLVNKDTIVKVDVLLEISTQPVVAENIKAEAKITAVSPAAPAAEAAAVPVSSQAAPELSTAAKSADGFQELLAKMRAKDSLRKEKEQEAAKIEPPQPAAEEEPAPAPAQEALIPPAAETPAEAVSATETQPQEGSTELQVSILNENEQTKYIEPAAEPAVQKEAEQKTETPAAAVTAPAAPVEAAKTEPEQAPAPAPSPAPAVKPEQKAQEKAQVMEEAVPLKTQPKKEAAAKRGPSLNKTHRVEPGETLSSIALAFYGDKTRWVDIYEANKDKVEKGAFKKDDIIILP